MPRPIEEMSEKEQRDELQALLKDYKNLTDLDKRRAEILENQLATIDEQRSSIKDLTKDLLEKV